MMKKTKYLIMLTFGTVMLCACSKQDNNTTVSVPINILNNMRNEAPSESDILINNTDNTTTSNSFETEYYAQDKARLEEARKKLADIPNLYKAIGYGIGSDAYLHSLQMRNYHINSKALYNDTNKTHVVQSFDLTKEVPGYIDSILKPGEVVNFAYNSLQAWTIKGYLFDGDTEFIEVD